MTISKVETINVISIKPGGSVTFPEDPNQCWKNLDACYSGFTLTISVNFQSITDDEVVIVTTGGDDVDSRGKFNLFAYFCFQFYDHNIVPVHSNYVS